MDTWNGRNNSRRIEQGEKPKEHDALKEFAGRVSKLSYREMNQLATAVQHELSAKSDLSPISVAESILSAAEKLAQ